MLKLPLVLARDYLRYVVWPRAMLYGSLAILAAIVLGVMP